MMTILQTGVNDRKSDGDKYVSFPIIFIWWVSSLDQLYFLIKALQLESRWCPCSAAISATGNKAKKVHRITEMLQEMEEMLDKTKGDSIMGVI